MPAITNFKGIVSDADFGDVPDGASQSQKNLSTTRPGVLIPRKGIQPATFDSTSIISAAAYNTFQKITFCKTRLGDLIGVNGVEQGFRWDGASTTVEPLGVKAPLEQPKIRIQPIQTSTDNVINTIVAADDSTGDGYEAGDAGLGTYFITLHTASHGLLDGDKIHIANVQSTVDSTMELDLNDNKFVVRDISGAGMYLEHVREEGGTPTVHSGTYNTTNKGNWSLGSSGTTIPVDGDIAAHQSDDVLGEGATAGQYYCGYRYVTHDSTPVYSAISPEMVEFPDQAGTWSFKWSDIKNPTSDDDPTGRINAIELWRSTSNSLTAMYKVHTITEGVTNDGATLHTSSGSTPGPFEDKLDDDSLLSIGDPLFIVADDGYSLIARRQVLPPNDMAYVVMFQDRYFYFGIVKYNRGTITVGGSTAATATVTITDFTELNAADKVNLIATDGTSYDFVNGAQSSVLGTWESDASNNQTATNLATVINTSSGPSGSRFTAAADGAVVTITQIAGLAGNTAVTLTDSGTAGMSKTDFTGGSNVDLVTGTGTTWTSEMEGRYIECAGVNNANLLITGVDVGAQTLDIDQDASAVTDVSYVITPEKSRRRQILFSWKDEPESVPETNSITLQENAGDDDEIVGAMPYGPYLYVLSQRHKYSLSYTLNPAVDGSVRFLDDRGAFNHSCWDIFENTAYLMDDAGCYSFDGKESKTISGAIQDLWRRDGPGDKIDFSKQANFFVKADRPKEKIYFFMSFVGDGDDLPTRALVFNIRRETFDPMHYPVQICGAAMVEKDGETRLVFGSENEKIHLTDEGTTDVLTSEVLGVGAASASATLVCDPGVFVGGHVGASVYIYEGTGKGQRRTINVVDSGTQVTLRTAWTTTPDATSKFVVGAVEWNWKSSSFPMSASDDRTPRSVELKFKPTTNPQSADVRMFYNGSTTVTTNETSVNEGDAVEIRETNKDDVVFHMKAGRSILSDSTGRETYRFSGVNSISGQGDHSLAIELRGYAGDEAQEIQEINIDGVSSVGSGE